MSGQVFIRQSRIVCGKCKKATKLSSWTGHCCDGATYMAIADARCWEIDEAFAEIECMDMMVSAVELECEDLFRFQRKYPNTTDYEEEGIHLWGAMVHLVDGKLIVWDERAGRTKNF
jgi:hypothetical protein